MGTDYERRLIKDLVDAGLPTSDADVPPAFRTAMKTGDVVIPPWGGHVLEVKKTRDPEKLGVTAGGNAEQFEEMQAFARMGVNAWYAIYHAAGARHGRWRFHKVPTDPDASKTFHRADGLTIDAFTRALLP